jgi:transcriptional regulator with XRE-family HTH domain
VSATDSNAGQNEFAQIFERLAKDFKLTKAEVGRALLINRSYVSMLVEGQREPSIRILEAMRGLEKRMRKGDRDGVAEDKELNNLMLELKTLKEMDPTAFQAVKKVVETLTTSLKSVAAASPKKNRVK